MDVFTALFRFSCFTLYCLHSTQLCMHLLRFGAHVLQVLPTNLPSSRPITHPIIVYTVEIPRCRIYIDGEEDAEGSLPKHMLTPGGMVKDVLESQHPYANNMDK